MAALVGYDVNVTWNATEIAGLDELGFRYGREVIQVTTFADTAAAASAFHRKLMGIKDGGISGSGQYENVAGQNALRTDFDSATSRSVVITWTGSNTFTVTCFVTDYGVDVGVEGSLEASFELTFNSTVTIV